MTAADTREARKDAGRQASHRRWVDRLPGRLHEAADAHDPVAVAQIVDTVLAGDRPPAGLRHPDDVLWAATRVLAAGVRSSGLSRLGFSGQRISALLAWWDTTGGQP